MKLSWMNMIHEGKLGIERDENYMARLFSPKWLIYDFLMIIKLWVELTLNFVKK